MSEFSIEVRRALDLRYDDGSPVRAASAITRFEDGWLVVSDDATHAAHWTQSQIVPIRVLDAVEGHEVFSEAAATKHLKPDFEAACRIRTGEIHSSLLLGSGSTAQRMRGVLLEEDSRRRVEADLTPLYARAAAALDIPADSVNLEGACPIDGHLRWFQRGNRSAGVPSASIDIELDRLLSVLVGRLSADDVAVVRTHTYDVGAEGSALAVTDAVALPDGRIVLSAAGEDTPNAVDDGPVVDAALALIDEGRVVATAHLPHGDDGPPKVEGLALRSFDDSGVHLVAVCDADDPDAPSLGLELRVSLP